MSTADPKVSIIIATYQPGEGLQRVLDSIDEQTMPQEEFEVVFVDDGSPDDTFDRLLDIAAVRPNVQAFRIENSGWPSRPRNVGMDHARGEYVMFMDHDDSLFPDGLRRAYEYAVETGADLLSPKESKTNDRWWGMSSLREGNLANVAGGAGINYISPLVPHKLYRRSMMLEHRIRFPEGSRVLWEDQFINVDAFRHAQVVSVLADTPVYLWHASDTNSSHTFDPVRNDFWDRLDDLLAHISKALRTKQTRESRRELLAMHLRVRVIDRMVRLLTRDDSDRSEMALRRARQLLRRYGSKDVIAVLPRKHQIQAELLRRNRRDLLVAFHQHDLAGGATSTITSMEWSDGDLQLEIETTLAPKQATHPILYRSGDRVMLAAPPNVAANLPEGLMDVTSTVGNMTVDLVVRGRRGHITWAIPSTDVTESEVVDGPKGLSLRLRSTATIDIRAAAAGRPLDDNVWDLSAEVDWDGMMRRLPVSYGGAPLPGLTTDRPTVPYANSSKHLSIDLAGWLRTFTSDAQPVAGPAGTTSAVRLPLRNLFHSGEQRYVDDSLVAIPDIDPATRETKLSPEAAPDTAAPLQGTVVADDAGTRLEGQLDASPGSYRIFANRDDSLHRTRHSVRVDESGSIEWLVD